jgi:hypothetical protein
MRMQCESIRCSALEGWADLQHDTVGGSRLVIHLFSGSRLWRGAKRLFGIVAIGWLAVACDSSTRQRVSVPSSDPAVSCTLVEGPNASKDANAAIARAKATWASIHEKVPTNSISAPEFIVRFEPYSATLKDGVWHVQGTIPPGFHGYAPVMSLCKNDEGASAGSIHVP